MQRPSPRGSRVCCRTDDEGFVGRRQPGRTKIRRAHPLLPALSASEKDRLPSRLPPDGDHSRYRRRQRHRDSSGRQRYAVSGLTARTTSRFRPDTHRPRLRRQPFWPVTSAGELRSRAISSRPMSPHRDSARTATTQAMSSLAPRLESRLARPSALGQSLPS
jgi:hypothetical protein